MSNYQVRTSQLRPSGTPIYQDFAMQNSYEALFYKTVSPPLVLDEGRWGVTAPSIFTTTSSLDCASNGTSSMRVVSAGTAPAALYAVTFTQLPSVASDFVQGLNAQVSSIPVPYRPIFSWEAPEINIRVPSAQPGVDFNIELSYDLCHQMGFDDRVFPSVASRNKYVRYKPKKPFFPLLPLHTLHVCVPSLLESNTRLNGRFMTSCLRVDADSLNDPNLMMTRVTKTVEEPTAPVGVKTGVISFLNVSIVTPSGKPLRFIVPPRYFAISFVLEKVV